VTSTQDRETTKILIADLKKMSKDGYKVQNEAVFGEETLWLSGSVCIGKLAKIPMPGNNFFKGMYVLESRRNPLLCKCKPRNTHVHQFKPLLL
jgi:hypothetical protein